MLSTSAITKKENLRFSRAAFITAGVAIPIALILWPSFYEKHIGQANIALVISILSALFCLTAQGIIEIISRIEHACTIAAQSTNYHETLQNALIPKRLHFLFEDTGKINEKILRRIIPSYIESLKYDDDSFSLSGDYWSYLGYEKAWIELIEKQLTSKEPIRVNALDMSYLRFSNSEDYKTKVSRLIDLQERFLKAKGEICRIFLLNEKIDKDRIQTIFARLNKKQYKYSSHFLIPKNRPPEDFFVAVSPSNQNITTCIWHYENNETPIPDSIEFSSTKGPRYLRIWHEKLDEVHSASPS